MVLGDFHPSQQCNNLARHNDAWGNLEAGGSAAGHAFTGREWDPDTQLHYYRARYYDATIGRFLSEDPIRHAKGDENFYSYVRNDPTTWSDPFGLYGKYVRPSPPLPDCPKRPMCDSFICVFWDQSGPEYEKRHLLGSTFYIVYQLHSDCSDEFHVVTPLMVEPTWQDCVTTIRPPSGKCRNCA